MPQPPYPRMSTPASPMKKVPRLVTRLDVVSVVFTFSKMRMTPVWKISPSFSRAWNPLMTRMPPSASVSRPVTSARICPRSLNAGRSLANAFVDTNPKPASGTRTSAVMIASTRIRMNSTTIAVTHAAHQLHQPGADEVPDALDVIHDARHELARLGVVEDPHRQVEHVALHLRAELRDEVLGLHAEQEHERIGRGGLDGDRSAHEPDQRIEQVDVAVADHVVDDVAAGVRQDQARQAVDEDQDQAQGDELPAWPDDLLKRVPEASARYLLRSRIRHGVPRRDPLGPLAPPLRLASLCPPDP